MMVQMVDTVSWISALIHETKTWGRDAMGGRKSENTLSKLSALRPDNPAIKSFREQSLEDV
jgi:hypothetical protein